VAADLGYADQPHLTRDFARVTGMTPGQFAARYTETGTPGPVHRARDSEPGTT
jgi:AraC-like DNA-binding protein